MSSVRNVFLASTAAIAFACPAIAADMPHNPPPQVIIQQVQVPVIQEFNGWYLRGDIGMTNQKTKGLENPLFGTAPNFTWLDKGEFTSGISYGLGVGWQANDWFRVDFTGEYRGGSKFHALDSFFNPNVPAGTQTNDYTFTKKEWLFLANAYLDLGTWWCITPFIGAGVGVANLTIANYRDNNIIAGGGGWAKDNTETNFAWALHAGASYAVTKSFAVELSYRYLNLGDGKSGDTINFDGTNLVDNPTTVKDITSHDVRLGVRWTCCDEATVGRPGPYMPATPTPVYSQPIAQPQMLAVPQQTYAPPPPPVYSQPQYAPPPPAYPQQYSPQPSYQQPYPQQQYPQPGYSQPPLSRRG
jgi:opacity protein-like surface antigen